ncbi:MAG: peptide chain release factor 2 [Rickettsiales bacterium]|nr:peptide chain release factor 2 [Rickettsiales bacterium]
MKIEALDAIKNIKKSFAVIARCLDKPALEKKLSELTEKSSKEDFWNNQKEAQTILKEKSAIENKLNAYNKILSAYEDAETLNQLGVEANDNSAIEEAENSFITLEKQVKKFELEALFTGEADANNAFLEVHSGAGGTESCDWAMMLMRMYLRWAEANNFKTEILDELQGEEAGIKSATIRIIGENAYGWLKGENGVHRLVRISPFDANAKRHTSFASITIYPEVDDNIEIKIEDKDIRIDTLRASGAGGQHVNKTESAIRITHIPTNIVVSCQNSRSQHSNKAEAFRVLRAKLYEQEIKKREAEKQLAEENKSDNSWGNQIRSYVLHPYQMVKDLRTGFETSDTSGVLDGNLQGFMNSWLSGERRE